MVFFRLPKLDMPNLCHCILILAGIVWLTLTNSVQATDSDILLFNNRGMINAGVVNPKIINPTMTIIPPLYSQHLGTVGSTFYSEDNPGFLALNTTDELSLLSNADLYATAIPITHPNTGVSRNLWYWDGKDDDKDGDYFDDIDFTRPPKGVDFRFSKTGFLLSNAAGTNDRIPLFGSDSLNPVSLGMTGSKGELHRHITFSVRGDRQIIPELPPDGHYLVALEMSMAGLVESNPLYLLFNANFIREVTDKINVDNGTNKFNQHSETAAVQWLESQLLNFHRWRPPGNDDNWFQPRSWLKHGIPDPQWHAIVANEDANGIQHAIVSDNSTITSMGISGSIESMIVHVNSIATLNATQMVVVGDGGQLEIEGTLKTDQLRMANGAKIKIVVSGNQAGQFGKVNILGHTMIDGELELQLKDGFDPEFGDRFDVFEFEPQNLIGVFENIALPVLDNHLYWQLSNLYTTGEIAVTSINSSNGDFDNDNDTDGDDYIIWQNHFPITSGVFGFEGDANQDGRIDGDDYLIWQNHFQIWNVMAVIPEPNSLALLTIIAYLILTRRRHSTC